MVAAQAIRIIGGRVFDRFIDALNAIGERH
jgi:hypothetical protein